MKTVFFIIMLSLFSIHYAIASPFNKESAIAIMDFGTRPGATTAEINIQNAEYTSSEYLISRFVEKQYFKVMDKDIVMGKLKSENLKTVGIIDPDTARKIGNILGVKYIVYGSVVNVSLSDVGTQILVSGVTVCTVKARIIARVMDVETGEILMVTRGEGKSKSSFTKIQLGVAPVEVPVIAIGTTKVTMDSVHNAIQKAAFDTVDKMCETVGKSGNQK